MRRIAVILTLCLTGCAGMDSATRMQFEQARSRVGQEPEVALEELNKIVEEYPEVVEVRRARADAFEQLGRDKDAFEEWLFVVRVRAAKSVEDLRAAHYGSIENGEKLLGDLPHRIVEPPRGEQRDLIVALQSSYEALLEEYPDDRDLRLGKASCMYRLGLYHRARPVAKALVDENPEDYSARYVLNLVREQEVGVHDRAVREFCDLVHATDLAIARQAAKHLIVLAEHPAIDALVKDNLRGILLRMVRRNQAPAEVETWIQRYNGEEGQRLAGRRLMRQFKEVDTARALNDWDRAWQILSEMPDENSQVKRKRAELLEGWSGELLAEGEQRLQRDDLQGVAKIAKSLEMLPSNTLPAELRGRRQSFLDSFNRQQARLVAKTRLVEASRMLVEQKPEDAMKLLDDLAKDANPTMERQISILRAEALYLKGDLTGALSLLDAAGEVDEPRHQRLLGILLSQAGRAEEAIPLLEGLPFSLQDATAIVALVSALERQGDWEAVLGRLVARRPLQGQEKSIYEKACREATNKRIRNNNYKGALNLLRSYASEDQLFRGELRVTYLEALLHANERAEARELVLSPEFREGPAIPSQTAKLALNSLQSLLAPEEQFLLLNEVEDRSDPELQQVLSELWPRFGSYLPDSGNYSIRYRATAYSDSGSAKEPSYHAVTMSWDGSKFVISGKNMPQERWWVQNGLWYRKTPVGTMEIPIRSSDGTREPHSYQLGNTEWTAEVVESAKTVKVDDQSYYGCIRVKLIPNGVAEESILLDVAPELGEVRREVYRDGRLQFTRELMRLTRLP